MGCLTENMIANLSDQFLFHFKFCLNWSSILYFFNFFVSVWYCISNNLVFNIISSYFVYILYCTSNGKCFYPFCLNLFSQTIAFYYHFFTKWSILFHFYAFSNCYNCNCQKNVFKMNNWLHFLGLVEQKTLLLFFGFSSGKKNYLMKIFSSQFFLIEKSLKS